MPTKRLSTTFAIGPNFQVWISAANRVPNDRSQRETARFGSLRPWITTKEKFRKVGKTSFCKGGDHMNHVVPPLVFGRIFKCGYLLPIEWQTIRVNVKQQDLAASGLGSPLNRSLVKLVKRRFAKWGPHEPCGPHFGIGPNFQIWISAANLVPNDRSQRQTTRFGSLWPWLTTKEKFRKVGKTSFWKGAPHEPCGAPFAIGPNFQVWISSANRVARDLSKRQTARFSSLWPWLTTKDKFQKVGKTSFCKGSR